MSQTTETVRDLVLSLRWAAIATLDGGSPRASMVAYAVLPHLEGLLLFLSGLSGHTQDLLQDSRASLAISAPDHGSGDPQLLARVTLTGSVAVVEPEANLYETARNAYLERFPDAEMRFGLADFVMFLFTPADVQYVGGFARAARMTWGDLTDTE